MTLLEAIKTLADSGVESPEYDARRLFEFAGGFKPHELVSRSVELDDSKIKPFLERRASREPLQYIIGTVDFYKESYEVSPDSLIPRQDTELLVEYAVKNIPEGEGFIDLCTGSGCIAISTLKNTKNTVCTAVELSAPALSLAKRNAERNSVGERLSFELSDALEYSPKAPVFAVLSNPPYVTEAEYKSLERELYSEPKMAFVGGEDGLDFYRRIVPNVKNSLKNGGFIAFEIGKDQSDGLSLIAEENGMAIEILKDYSQLPRLAVLRKK